MRRQNAERFHSGCVRWFHAIGLTFNGLLLVAASSHAGVLTASWTAPTTNTDGSALMQLALYRVYYSTSDAPCPGSTFFEVASSTSMPPANSVSVTAVDTSGNESACSDVASAIAQDDSATTPITQDGSVSTPVAQDGSATIPKSFCPPGQAKKGRC